MKTETYLAELGTPDSTPGLALSLLRNRIKGVEYRHEGGVLSVGTASSFHLAEITDFTSEHEETKRIGLVCCVEMDVQALDSIKHLLANGAQLTVEGYPVIRAVGP